MSDEHPKNDPKKNQQHDQPNHGYHEKKIEQLEKMRRLSPPAPVFKPRGSPPHKQLNDADKKYNAALDRQVKYWHDQAEKTQGMEGKAREPFNKEVSRGKIKGKAQDRFNRASGIER